MLQKSSAAWYSLGENGWNTLGENAWYIMGRKMTAAEGIEAGEGSLRTGLRGDQSLIAPGVSAGDGSSAIDFRDQSVSGVEIVGALASRGAAAHVTGGVVGVGDAVVHARELALRIVRQRMAADAGEAACRVVLETGRAGQTAGGRGARQLVVDIVGPASASAHEVVAEVVSIAAGRSKCALAVGREEPSS